MAATSTRIVVALVAVIGSLSLPGSASALAPSIVQNIDAVHGMVEKGGIPSGRLPVACGPTCAKLWESEHALIPGQPTSASLHAELNTLRTKSRLLPPLGTTLSNVTLAATAFTVGWEIGTAARSVFFSSNLPPTSARFTAVKWREKGWCESANTSCTGMVILPVDGNVGLRDGASPVSNLTAAQRSSAAWSTDIPMLRALGPGDPAGSLDVMYYTAAPMVPAETAPAGATMRPKIIWPTSGTGTNGEPTATTEQRVKDELDLNPSRYPTLTPWLENELTPKTAVVPSCAGDLWSACQAKIIAEGLAASRLVLSFSAADLDKPAAAVITLDPPAPTTVEKPATVTVTTNPDAQTMPVRVPGPLQHETYAQYLARLQAAGHTGTATRLDLTDATLDPARGPSEVVSTSPAAGTRIAPDSAVTVRANPETAPEVAGSGGTGNPSTHAINLAPLNVAGLCSNFPFGVPCWLYDVMSSWVVGTPEPPSWQIPFPFVAVADRPSIDLADWDAWAPQLRALILLVAAVGIALKFYALATGQSRGGDGD